MTPEPDVRTHNPSVDTFPTACAEYSVVICRSFAWINKDTAELLRGKKKKAG